EVDANVRASIPVLSFFSRLTPTRNDPNQGATRFEVLRRGGRRLDISPALTSGALVVLAECDEPLPVPLEVAGERVGGNGVTIYQFVLPLDCSIFNAPTTQPSEEIRS
ncbi:MAG: hypothetical protein ACREJC_10605, partial [Tepidisphaeraceae bacterium]